MTRTGDLVDAVVRTRTEREAHRLAYAYHLTWLIDAMRMPQAWRDEHRDELLEAAGMCRRERAEATGTSMAEADRLWGTVLERAEDIAGGAPW